MYNAYKNGYDTIIDKIDRIIDNQLDKNNRKLKKMKDMQQTDISSFEKLLDETSDIADYLNGMYDTKHILMLSIMDIRKEKYNNDVSFETGFNVGKMVALEKIEEIIRQSKKYLYEIENESKKQEYQKKITGAEYLYHCIKKELNREEGVLWSSLINME